MGHQCQQPRQPGVRQNTPIASPGGHGGAAPSQRRSSCAATLLRAQDLLGRLRMRATRSEARRSPAGANRSRCARSGARRCCRRCRRRSGSHRASAVDPVERRIVGPVEEVLHHPEDGCQVLRRREKIAVGRQHVGRAGHGGVEADGPARQARMPRRRPPALSVACRRSSSDEPRAGLHRRHHHRHPGAAIDAVGDRTLPLPRSEIRAPPRRDAGGTSIGPSTASEATRPRPSRAWRALEAGPRHDPGMSPTKTICWRRSPEFARGDASAMQSPRKPRHDAEVRSYQANGASIAADDAEEAPQAVRVTHAGGEGPRDDDPRRPRTGRSRPQCPGPARSGHRRSAGAKSK